MGGLQANGATCPFESWSGPCGNGTSAADDSLMLAKSRFRITHGALQVDDARMDGPAIGFGRKYRRSSTYSLHGCGQTADGVPQRCQHAGLGNTRTWTERMPCRRLPATWLVLATGNGRLIGGMLSGNKVAVIRGGYRCCRADHDRECDGGRFWALPFTSAPGRVRTAVADLERPWRGRGVDRNALRMLR